MSDRARRWLEGLLLLAILAAAAWLRWLYARDVSPYVDEYITQRAARQILDRGLPLLPTGNFYSHGLLLSYVEAGIMALAGFDPLAARLPVLLVSLGTVVLTWRLGRRWFSPPVGLLAAALLALYPEAIVWGGRARMYAPLQFFVLLALFSYFSFLVSGRRRDAALFALSFLAALFNHAQAMLLLPVLGLIAVAAAWPGLRRGAVGAVLGRWWRSGLLAAWVAAGLGILAELWFRSLGPAMVSRLAEGVYGPSERAYLAPAWDWPGMVKTLEPVFTWTPLLAVVGLLLLAWLWRLARRRQAGPLLPEGWGRVLAYLVAVVALTLAFLLVAADPSWKSSRYLFMLLPALFLALAVGLLGVVIPRAGKTPSPPGGEGRGEGGGWPWLILALALVLVAAGGWSPAWSAAHEEVAAYDRAFEYVADEWQPGDAVMTFVPQAAIFYLGQCDYLSVPTDYRGFAYEENGRWLEGWDGIPMVDSAAGVAESLMRHERLWFVVDESRFHTRFAHGFAQAVWDGLDLVWLDGGVMVFRTAAPPPPSVRRARRVELGGQIALEGYALHPFLPQPGGNLPVTLLWSAIEFPAGIYSAFLHLVDADGAAWSQSDGPPLGGVYPTNRWWPGETQRDRRTLPLPADLPPGLYRLETGLYDPATMEHLRAPGGAERVIAGFVQIGETDPLPAGMAPVGLDLGAQIRLLAYRLDPAGEGSWTLTLAWEAVAPVAGDYTTFVHLVDAAGDIRAQHDAPPGGGFYPTLFWTPGERVVGRHELALPADAPPGEYHLRVGLYDPATGARLPASTGADFVELATWMQP